MTNENHENAVQQQACMKDGSGGEEKKEVKKGKKPEKTVRVKNVFMMKKLIDSPEEEDGIQLIGTFIQQVFDLTEEQYEKKDFAFGYRFNETTATEETGLQKRRTEAMATTETMKDGTKKDILGARTTYQAQIPLVVETLISLFPYRIVTATATVELSSLNLGEGTIRPDLFLHKKDPRHNINIQGLKPDARNSLLSVAMGGKTQKKDETLAGITEQIFDKLDKMKKYDIVHPYPKVYIEYEKKKAYAPRFVLSFYCITSGFAKIVSIILPVLLVTFITIINVFQDVKQVSNGDGGEEVSNHLQVMSGMTLTAVFILPEILDPSNRNDLFGSFAGYAGMTLTAVFILPEIIDPSNRNNIFGQSNIYVILVFLSLILTSIPYGVFKTVVPEIVGAVMMFASFLLPLVNTFRYYRIIRRIKGESMLQSDNQSHRFLGEKSYKQWNAKDGIDEYAVTAELLKPENLKGYGDVYMTREEEEAEEGGNYRRLWWSTGTANKKKHHLQVMSGMTLTAVFILPEILDPSNRNDLFGQSNIYVILVFLSLILTSIPKAVFKTQVPEIIGVVIMFASFVLPVVNTIRYYGIIRRIKGESMLLSDNQSHRFLSEKKGFKQWNAKDGIDEYAVAADLLKPENLKGYGDIYMTREEEEAEEGGNYRRLWWSTGTANKKKQDDNNGESDKGKGR
eukprot:CAMPEP_0194194178 /NCGR_PEP_ID=MMETSP0154-20130528/75436_1 /TAXON_ID=1049557 /ORGANISM="Thalassiothrix antarctica, Strain L6-D1" /LENGTH=680 /DNA_ID=CAMNT_0038918581 /DNA_START=129 /DNA_END=2172 /DNA_ORIENTATION=+